MELPNPQYRLKFHKHFKSLPDLEDRYFRLVVAPEGRLASVKKDVTLPVSIWEDFELTPREPVKALAIPQGLYQQTTVVIFREGISPFMLHEALRKAMPSDVSKLSGFYLDTTQLSRAENERVTNAVGNLLTLSAYEPPKYGKKAERKKKSKLRSLTVHFNASEKSSRIRQWIELGFSQADSANLVRLLSEMPGNELTPTRYLSLIRKWAKAWGLEFEFLDQRKLAALRMNAFLAVSRAQPDGDHGLVHLRYRPKRKRSGRKVALIGKGLCFDTGGYNIKVGGGMLDMHRDMTGSAVALALIKFLSETESRDEVHAYLALAENLISPTAYRPNDVVVASNGVSIEVVDTDAEGRMVLSDTLVYADKGRPDLMIDFATLTGAIVRAIDTRQSGVFSNQNELRELAVKVGAETGERVWGFPLGEDYWEGIHSDLADVRQCGIGDNCDHIYAATFLSAFVRPETPWLHVDLSAESHKGGLGLSARDVTGFGIRFASELIKQFDRKSATKRRD